MANICLFCDFFMTVRAAWVKSLYRAKFVFPGQHQECVWQAVKNIKKSSSLRK